MNISLIEMMRLNPHPLDASPMRATLKRLLTVLDILHSEANVVYTDMYVMVCTFLTCMLAVLGP